MGSSQSLDRIRSIDSKEFSESVEGRTGIEKQLTMEADLMHCEGTTLLSVVRTECPSLSEGEAAKYSRLRVKLEKERAKTRKAFLLSRTPIL